MRVFIRSAIPILALGATTTSCLDSPEFVTADASADGSVSTPPSSLDGGGGKDAGSVLDTGSTPPSCAPAECASLNGVCDGAACVINCTSADPDKCKNARCPPGGACRITCTGKQACDKVDCAGATSCTVRCVGEQACNGDIKSDTSNSEIVCDGPQACNGKVECRGASCAVTCTNAGCKTDEVKCCATQCTVNGVATGCK